MSLEENRLLNETDDEYSQFLNIARERNISPNKLLEEELQPFQEKIKLRNGELIAAITRDYDQSGWSTPPRMYSSYIIKEILYVGNITNKTCLPSPSQNDFCLLADFVKNVNNPCKKRDYLDDLFSRTNTESFQSSNIAFSLVSLYFHNKPPILPADADEETHYTLTQLSGPRPRLELYIGNAEVLPRLERLTGYQFTQLSRLLRRDLPVSEKMQKRIREEQLPIYEQILALEKLLPRIEKTGEDRVELVRKSGGAIHHGTHIELTDPDLEILRYKREAGEVFARLNNLINKAVIRNYHRDGLIFDRETDAGVREHLDLRIFFTNRTQKYEVNTT